MKKAFGNVIGAAVIVAITAAVVMWPKPKREAPTAPAVRPIKSMELVSGVKSGDLHFAAKVKAGTQRVLRFKQSGMIQKMAVDSGVQVVKGQKLAWLDPSDYKSKLAIAEANAVRNRNTFERTEKAFKLNAVSKEELSKAEAEMKITDAAVEVARRALDETVLYAPFDGIVAKTIASEMEMVDQSGSRDILIVQDNTKVKVEAVYPETMVIKIPMITYLYTNNEDCVDVTFDAAPGKVYKGTFIEHRSTSEGGDDQTYSATYSLPCPTDILPLPGMSATVTIPGNTYTIASDIKEGWFKVPESAIGAASDGSHFVWILTPSATDGVYGVTRRTVTVAMYADGTVVDSGLTAGERIATSGVSALNEDSLVSLIEE